MMVLRKETTIFVMCDTKYDNRPENGCGSMYVPTRKAKGCMRKVNAELRMMGWLVTEDNRHYCPACKKWMEKKK